MFTVGKLKSIIDVAAGREIPDTLLTHAKLVNVFTGEIYETHIAVVNDVIAGVRSDYTEGKQIIDCHGQYVIPGLIDAHMHLESSLLSPAEFAKAVIPHGTTTIVIDPHEIGNVLGMSGIEYMINATQATPLNAYVMAPSCVPATHMETAGAELNPAKIETLLSMDGIHGLAEMMNFPGVFLGIPDVLKKLEIAGQADRPIDGHSPGLSGKNLNAYLAAGILSDHECTTPEEALEKLRLGANIFIREGSAAKNLEALIGIVNEKNYHKIAFATDDRHPDDLVEDGHMDDILRRAIRQGIDPVRAVQMCTLNAATHHRLRKRGAIAPGYFADIVVVDNLTDFNVKMTFTNGKLVFDNTLVVDIPDVVDDRVVNTMNVQPLQESDFRIPVRGEQARIVKIIPNQIVTDHYTTVPKQVNQAVVADLERDILKFAVIERHKATGNIGLGLVNGFGLKKGAIASSVAHDSHNLIVVGTSDAEMKHAAERAIEIGGGFVVVADGNVLGECPLPIAGLMSDQPVDVVREQLHQLHHAAEKIGSVLPNPFITLAFIALPVIPALKLTDKGLVDVNQFEIVDLWV
ncbi:MAG: adenine deaminase [Gemmatimonadetes bacterium]|nr:MAG: adenine deaminase [Gemmatimonadota bacterium]